MNVPDNERDPILELLLSRIGDPQRRERLTRSMTQLRAAGPDGFASAFLDVQAEVLAVTTSIGDQHKEEKEQRKAVVDVAKGLRKFETETLTKFERMILETRDAFLRIRGMRIGSIVLILLSTLILGVVGGIWSWNHFFGLTENQIKWLKLHDRMIAEGIDMVPKNDKTGSYGLLVGSNRPCGEAKLWKPEGTAQGVIIYWPDVTSEEQKQ